MRSVRFYWVKFVIVSLGLIALTVAATMYFTSRCPPAQTANTGIGVQIGENGEGIVSKHGEIVFPEDMQQAQAGQQESAPKKNLPVMIRRPNLVELNPQPADWATPEVARALNLKEIPASRPPKCILLGFAKCGTSALLEFLDLHPKIVSMKWEPDYFCDRMYLKYDLRWYVKAMPPSYSDQITIEKSPCYIVEHNTFVRMHALNSSLKIMVIIRDPITRLLSEYGHYFDTESYWGRIPVPFEIRVFNGKTQQFREQVLKVGDYNPHFENLLKVFPRDQLLIVDGDKFVTDPLSQIRIIEDFLGLEHAITDNNVYFDTNKGFYCTKRGDTQEAKCLGKSKGRKHVEIEPVFKAKLIEYFKPYNEKFFQLVGQRFDWLQ